MIVFVGNEGFLDHLFRLLAESNYILKHLVTLFNRFLCLLALQWLRTASFIISITLISLVLWWELVLPYFLERLLVSFCAFYRRFWSVSTLSSSWGCRILCFSHCCPLCSFLVHYDVVWSLLVYWKTANEPLVPSSDPPKIDCTLYLPTLSLLPPSTSLDTIFNDLTVVPSFDRIYVVHWVCLEEGFRY